MSISLTKGLREYIPKELSLWGNYSVVADKIYQEKEKPLGRYYV